MKTHVPFWQSGQLVGIVTVGVGTGVVVGGRAEVVSGADSVFAEGDSDRLCDSDTDSDGVSDNESVAVSELDSVNDAELDTERDQLTETLGETDSESEMLGVSLSVRTADPVCVGVGGGVTVRVRLSEKDRDLDRVSVRVFDGGGVIVRVSVKMWENVEVTLRSDGVTVSVSDRDRVSWNVADFVRLAVGVGGGVIVIVFVHVSGNEGDTVGVYDFVNVCGNDGDMVNVFGRDCDSVHVCCSDGVTDHVWIFVYVWVNVAKMVFVPCFRTTFLAATSCGLVSKCSKSTAKKSVPNPAGTPDLVGKFPDGIRTTRRCSSMSTSACVTLR